MKDATPQSADRVSREIQIKREKLGKPPIVGFANRVAVTENGDAFQLLFFDESATRADPFFTFRAVLFADDFLAQLWRRSRKLASLCVPRSVGCRSVPLLAIQIRHPYL